jgi:topoisomerase-4 subunit B
VIQTPARKQAYTEDEIKTLDWREHIRLRPGMYIGKLGDGASPDDGIYVLLKEVLDNCIDEFAMGYGKSIDITINEHRRHHSRLWPRYPLRKSGGCGIKINTGAKYDSKAFKKSVGLNGVGTKAVNALSEYFKVTAFREGPGKISRIQLRQPEKREQSSSRAKKKTAP